MTGKASMLSNIQQYSGTDSMLIGNGSSLPIHGIGDTFVKQNNITLPFHDVLLVPDLTKPTPKFQRYTAFTQQDH